MRTGRIRLVLLLLVISFIHPFSSVHGEEWLLRSGLRIAGSLPESGLELYAAEEESSRVLIEIGLGTDVILSAEVNHADRSFTIRSLSRSSGETVALSDAELAALQDLAARLVFPTGSLAEETLGRLLNLLHGYPAGEPIDLAAAGDLEKSFSEKSIKSLCGTAGRRTTGVYTVGREERTERAQVGPCYFQPARGSQCLGRCGPGCGAPPEPTFQQFAQDCLNHDLCTGFTGTILGECADEWRAAADDFLFASDCGDLDGKWTDQSKYQFNLTQTGFDVRGSVTGRVNNLECRTWSVQGRHNGDNVNFTASNAFQRNGCCTSFTLNGKAKSCSRITGTWTNVCGLRGTFTLNRKSRKSELQMMLPDDDEAVSPGSTEP